MPTDHRKPIDPHNDPDPTHRARDFLKKRAQSTSAMEQAAAFFRDNFAHLAASFYFGLVHEGLPENVALELSRSWLQETIRNNVSGGGSGSGGSGGGQGGGVDQGNNEDDD